MSSWGGVTFTVLSSGARRRQGAQISITHVPWSDTNVVSHGGRLPKRRHYEILITSEADYLSLEGQEGDTGTLDGPEGTVSAKLDKLESIEDFPDGKVRASSDWILL